MMDISETNPRYSIDKSILRDIKILIPLWIVNVLFNADRSIVYVLIVDIQKEFGLSDSASALYLGMAYAVPFALAGIPLGMAVDRVSKTRLLAILLFVCSACSIASALVGSFSGLLVSRVILGAAAAGAPPTMIALIAGSVHGSRLASALALFFTGAYAGSFLGAISGGYVADYWGWKTAFAIIGSAGVILSLAIFLWREPRRSVPASQVARPGNDSGHFAFPAAFKGRILCVAAALIIITALPVTYAAWLPTLLVRAYGMDSATAGALTGTGLGISGILGSLAAAFAFRRDHDATRMTRFCTISSWAAAPLAVGALALPMGTFVPVLLFLWGMLTAACIGPGFSMLTKLIPSRTAGVGVAVVIVLTHVIGAGIFPQIVGSLSDHLGHADKAQGLKNALLILSATAFLPPLLFGQHRLSLRSRPTDVARPANGS